MPDTGSPGTRLAILYVDDEPGLLHIGKLYLEREGEFAVTTIRSAHEAIQLLSEESFDAIISDYQMPGCDGICFLKHLRANGNPTPFIIFTGKGREDVVIDALNSGADFYLQKGGDPKSQFAELSNKIRYAISKRRSEQALFESEERYRNVVLVQTELICRFLPNGTILFANGAYCRTFDLDPDSVIGRRFKPKIHPDDVHKVALLYASLTPKEPSGTIDQRTIMKDGGIRWHRWSTTALFDERGILSEYQAVGKDITDLIERDFELQRKNDEIRAAFEQLAAAEEELRQQLDELTEAQHELREGRRQLRTILDHSYDGIIISDSDGAIIDVNETMLRMFGVSHEEALSSSLSEYLSGSRSPGQSEKGLMDGFSDAGELSALSARRPGDGTLFDVEVFRTRIRFEGRDLLLLNIRDLTDRKLADEAVRRRILIDQSRDGIVTLEQDGSVFESNRQFADMLGYTQDEIRNLHVWDWDFQFKPETLLEMLGTVGEDGDHFETLHCKKDGSVLSVDISTNAAVFSGKKLIFCVVRDITGKKLAEDALRNANRQLNLMTSITRHDIQNQLMITEGFLYMAKKRASGDEELLRQLEKIQISSEMIQRQIAFTKTYQDIGVHKPKWHELNSILPRTDVPAEIRLTAEVEDVSIFADPMISKVFENLLDNTIRHGEHVTRICVSYAQAGDDLMIIWEDDGAGIPENLKKKIFNRGFGKNTGYGLFLSSEILGITGIAIQETGVYGQGARFEILIPKGEFRISTASQAA